MTDQYSILATYYDRIMEDVDYPAWVRFYEQCFEKYSKKPKKIWQRSVRL